jgi:hypothetical protein
MPFCPKCESEYEAGVERCVDCDEVLVAHLPREEEEEDTKQEITYEPSDRLAQVAVFNNTIAANLCKARLESEGIECFLQGETAMNLHLRGSSIFLDVRLAVRESDAERAVEILKKEPLETDVEIEEEDTGGKDLQERHCPRCGSSDVVSQKHTPALILISLLLLGVPILLMRKKWKCRGCWHTWKAY